MALVPTLISSNSQDEVRNLVTQLNQHASYTDTVQDPNGPIVTTLSVVHSTSTRLNGGLPCGSSLYIRREIKQANRRVADTAWTIDLGKVRIQSSVSGSNWNITMPSAGIPIQQVTSGAMNSGATTRNLNTVTIQGNSSYPSKALLIAASTIAVGNKALEICQRQNR